MIAVDWIQAVGGLGVLLFSLRFLTNTLNESAASRFRPVLDRLLGSPVRCLGFGLAAAVLFQASGAVVVAAMGLVDSAMDSLEQGFLIMLGATVGTTFKMWFLAAPIRLGPILIGIGSLGVLLIRHPSARELLKILTAVGFTLLGLHMLAQSTAPITHQPAIATWLHRHAATTLVSQVLVVLAAAGVAAATQSGSAMVALAMGLAAQGTIGLQTGAAAVLGANLGTPSVGLLASLESGHDGRRLAVAHLLAKLFGVMVVLFFFPTFLAGVREAVRMVIPQAGPMLLLAGVHTAFNALNALWWCGFSSFMMQAVRHLVAGDDREILGLPQGIRRMLRTTPGRAEREVAAQFRQLELLVKGLYDHAMGALSQGARSPRSRERRVWLERSFSNLKATLHDLLFSLSSRAECPDRLKFLTMLTVTEIYSGLARCCYTLSDHLERGLEVDRFEIPDRLATSLEAFRLLLDGLWLAVLMPDQASGAQVELPARSLEQTVLEEARGLGGDQQDYLTWLFEIAGLMRAVAAHLGELQQLKLRRAVESPACEASED